MSNKRSDFSTRVETWTVKRGRSDAAVVTKVAVRNDKNGQFHGATNYRFRPEKGKR
jgi:hypothetical protein